MSMALFIMRQLAQGGGRILDMGEALDLGAELDLGEDLDSGARGGLRKRLLENRVDRDLRQLDRRQDKLARLQDGAVAVQAQRSLRDNALKDEYTEFTVFSLLVPASLAAGASTTFNQTPPAEMWASHLIISGADSLNFTSFMMQGQPLIQGASGGASFAGQGPTSQFNLPLNRILNTTPITGAITNVGAAAVVASISIYGFIKAGATRSIR